MSDHDLTPCNPSPNMLIPWGISGRIADQNDIEEGWRAHVHKVNEEANNQSILVTFVSFGKLFDELKAKTCVITQDSVVQLSKEKAAFSPDLVRNIMDQLQNLTDILSEDISYPHVWCDVESAGTKLMERLKFTILEIQENLDNFSDRKDFALECLDAIKTHQKLVSLGEQMTDYNMDNEPLDLVKCLYKLHFQLLLLLESFSKLLRLISMSNQDLATDKSRELALIQVELRKAIKELPKRTPSPELDPTVESGVNDLNKIRIDDDLPNPTKEDLSESISETEQENSDKDKSNESFAETLSADSSVNNSKESDELQPAENEQKIVDLIMESKWKEAVEAYKLHKTRWPSTLPLAYQVIGTPTEEDDVGAMLNLYCAALAEKSAGIFVMTLSDVDIAESCSRLMDAIQQLSQTIKQLETFHIKQLKMKSPPQGAPPPPPQAPVVVPSAPPIEAEATETSENPTPEPTKSEVPKTPEPSKFEVPKTPEPTKSEISKSPEPSKIENPKTPEPAKSEVSKTPEPLAKSSETELPKTPEPLNPEVSKTPEPPVINPEISEPSEAPAKAASESEDPVDATTIAPDNAEDVIVGEENVEIPSSSLSAVGEVIAESSITSAKPENEDVSSSTLQDEQELSSQQHQFSEL